MSDEKRSPLADLWQKEVDGTAKRIIRGASTAAGSLLAAEASLAAGATPSVVVEELERPHSSLFNVDREPNPPRLADASPFIVRPGTDDDLNFVRKTWLSEHSQQSDWIDSVGGGEVYFKEHSRCRDTAMDRGVVTIACRAAVPTGICGFSVTELGAEGDALVHFLYVKPRWRKLGAARLLLRPFLGRRAEFTHATRMLRLLPVPKEWSFNPYPFLRG